MYDKFGLTITRLPYFMTITTYFLIHVFHSIFLILVMFATRWRFRLLVTC